MTSFADGRQRVHPRPAVPAAVLVLATAVLAWVLVAGTGRTTPVTGAARSVASAPASSSGILSAPLARLAADRPNARVEVIVQLAHGAGLTSGRSLVRSLGGRPGPSLPIINGMSARISAAAARRLAASPLVRVVSLNAAIKTQATTLPPAPWALSTTFDQSVDATGLALLGPLWGRYAGTAPNANLISIKIADDSGQSTILDAIYGLQFAVDHQNQYNIRVVNLSFRSTTPGSHTTDPLDAAAEQAWLHGIVVVAAAGNMGTASDAVSYAPGNDPYVLTVGAVDEQGTARTSDDVTASWSSQGTTQDGLPKPDVLAPGAHIVSARSGERLRLKLPQLRDRRRLLSGQRDVAGGADRRRHRGGPRCCPSGLDARAGQGRDRQLGGSRL